MQFWFLFLEYIHTDECISQNKELLKEALNPRRIFDEEEEPDCLVEEVDESIQKHLEIKEVAEKGAGLFWNGEMIPKGTLIDYYNGEIFKNEENSPNIPDDWR